MSKEITPQPPESLIKNDHTFAKVDAPDRKKEIVREKLLPSPDKRQKNIPSVCEDIIHGSRSTTKSRSAFGYPSSNLLTHAQIQKLSFRQQLAYVTKQSQQQELKNRGHSIVNSSLNVYWRAENIWRVGLIESFCENTGTHKLNFAIHPPKNQHASMDIDLSTVESKLV